MLQMREHFLLEPGLTFLNHGSFGACPRVVMRAQQEVLLEIERNPVVFLGRRSAERLRRARDALGEFIGASGADLVFVENATVGVNIVAQSLELQAGDEILSSDHEYGACEEAWRRVCKKTGANYRTVAVPMPFDAARMVADFTKAITPATRVLFISHVTSPTALVFPLDELIEVAHRQGVRVVVDGAHGPAFLDLALLDSGVDFYTGNCHKWMCAPKGAGFLYVRADQQAIIKSPIISWGQVANVDGGPSPVEGFTGTSALERELQWIGTRDPSAALSVPAAIEFMAQHDWPRRRQHCRDLAQDLGQELTARLQGRPVASHRMDAQMVAVALPECDGETLRERLYQEHAIEMPVTRHAGRPYARVSVQVYNTEAELQHLTEVLPRIAREVAAAAS